MCRQCLVCPVCKWTASLGEGLERGRLTASTVSRLSPKITTGVWQRMLGRWANAIAMAHCSEPPEVLEGEERQRT